MERNAFLVVTSITIVALLLIAAGCAGSEQSDVTSGEQSDVTSGEQVSGCVGSSDQQEAPNATPNGKKIAFGVMPEIVASAGGWGSAASDSAAAIASLEQAVSGIWVTNVDGTDVTRLTCGGSDPTWSPDGKRIAYIRDGGEVYTISADGSNETKLPRPGSPPPGGLDYTPSPTHFTSWSPDGSRIALEWACNIFVMPTDGSSGPTLLTTDQHWQCAQSPTWSPDSKRIAISGRRDRGYAQIYIMNVSRKDDMNDWRQLTDSNDAFYDLSWSPDGTEIAFVRVEDGFYIYKIDFNSLKETRLTHSPGDAEGPSWSPDGKKITYVSADDIYVMNSDGSNPTFVADVPEAEIRTPAWQPLP